MPRGAAQGIEIQGLRELLRAFQKFDKDLTTDLVWELQEAVDPIRKATTQFILGGGGGIGAIENMPPTPYYADMRIGVSRGQGLVYVAPAWHRGTGAGTGRPNLSGAIRRRMEAAVQAKEKEVEERLGKWIDTLADDWGR